MFTFAQIVDGLPLSAVEGDHYYGSIALDMHPLHKVHTSLCEGAMDKATEFFQGRDFGHLEFETEVSFISILSNHDQDVLLLTRSLAS